MALSEFERETIITFSDGDGIARIYTAQRTVLTKLRKNKAAKEIKSGEFEGSLYATFEMPSDLISFRQQQRKQLTDEQRANMRAAIMERKPWEKRDQ